MIAIPSHRVEQPQSYLVDKADQLSLPKKVCSHTLIEGVVLQFQ